MMLSCMDLADVEKWTLGCIFFSQSRCRAGGRFTHGSNLQMIDKFRAMVMMHLRLLPWAHNGLKNKRCVVSFLQTV